MQTNKSVQQIINERVKLIEALDAEGIKRLMPDQLQTTVENEKQFLNAMANASLCDLLGIPEGNSHIMFDCVLPNHVGNHKKSAHIYTADNGIQFYKCFKCGKTYLANFLVEAIAKCSIQQAKDFISSVFNIDLFESEWLKNLKNMYDNNIERLILGDVKALAPTAYNYVRHDLAFLLIMNTLAKYHADPESITVDELPIFHASKNKITEKLTRYKLENDSVMSFGLNHNTVNKKIQNCNIVGFIKKLSIDQLPEGVQQSVLDYKKSSGYSKHTNVFCIPEYSASNLEMIESRSKQLKESHYTKRAASKEYILRSFGNPASKELYPQENMSLSEQSEQLTCMIQIMIQTAIKLEGYCTERMIIDSLGINEDMARDQIKRSLPQLLQLNSWQRIRCNKELKAKFQMDSSIKGYPFLIVAKSAFVDAGCI